MKTVLLTMDYPVLILPHNNNLNKSWISHSYNEIKSYTRIFKYFRKGLRLNPQTSCSSPRSLQANPSYPAQLVPPKESNCKSFHTLDLFLFILLCCCDIFWYPVNVKNFIPIYFYLTVNIFNKIHLMLTVYINYR